VSSWLVLSVLEKQVSSWLVLSVLEMQVSVYVIEFSVPSSSCFGATLCFSNPELSLYPDAPPPNQLLRNIEGLLYKEAQIKRCEMGGTCSTRGVQSIAWEIQRGQAGTSVLLSRQLGDHVSQKLFTPLLGNCCCVSVKPAHSTSCCVSSLERIRINEANMALKDEMQQYT
jgi:hypothetical protein